MEKIEQNKRDLEVGVILILRRIIRSAIAEEVIVEQRIKGRRKLYISGRNGRNFPVRGNNQCRMGRRHVPAFLRNSTQVSAVGGK